LENDSNRYWPLVTELMYACCKTTSLLPEYSISGYSYLLLGVQFRCCRWLRITI